MERKSYPLIIGIVVFMIAFGSYILLVAIPAVETAKLQEAQTVADNLRMLDIDDIDCTEADIKILYLTYETFEGAEIMLEAWKEVLEKKGCPRYTQQDNTNWRMLGEVIP